MKLEKQVCSLELSKKLKELGVKQESLFYWATFYVGGDEFRLYTPEEINNTHKLIKEVSAFTVAELGELLPSKIYKKGENSLYNENFRHKSGMFYCGYQDEDEVNFENNISRIAETEADARAEMLVYLVENNLIKN